MTELEKLWAAIKLKGQESEYREAIQSIPGGSNPSNNTTTLIAGGILIATACILNPTIPARFMAFVVQQQQALQDQQELDQEAQSPTEQYPALYHDGIERRTVIYK